MYICYMYVTVWKTSQLMWMQPKKKKRKKGKSETNGAKEVSGYGLQKIKARKAKLHLRKSFFTLLLQIN